MNQIELEETFSKRNIIKELRGIVASEQGKELSGLLKDKVKEYLQGSYWSSKNDYITAVNMMDIGLDDIVDHLLFVCLRESKTTIQSVSFAVGDLYAPFIDDVFIKVQIGSDLIEVCNGLLWNCSEGIFKSRYNLSDELKLKISKYMYLPPMIEKPDYISNNRQGGYRTFNENVILGGQYKHHNKTVRLDNINYLNSIKFVLDKEVIKEVEVRKKPFKTEQDKLNWEQYLKECELVKEEYKDKEFYFSHAVDSRGRIYCKGYHLSYQGTEYQKASISLAKYEACIE